LVGLNYVRAAATNLALTGTTPSLALLPHSGIASVEKTNGSSKLAAMEIPEQSRVHTNFPHDGGVVPNFAGYGDAKANSSLLKRLAEKFGLPQ